MMRARTRAEIQRDRLVWAVSLLAGAATLLLGALGVYSGWRTHLPTQRILAFIATLPPIVFATTQWWIVGKVVNAPTHDYSSIGQTFQAVHHKLLWGAFGGGVLIAVSIIWFRLAFEP